MKLSHKWYKAASTWVAAFIIFVPQLADALIEVSPYMGEHGKYFLSAAGLLMLIARVYPQKDFEQKE